MSTTGSSPATFVKYHGLGNDFILIDNTHSPVPTYTAVQAVKLCDRNFGIGADGIIFALPGENGCDFTMRIFNSDGSEPQMCGNGIRCLTKFLHDYVCKSTGKAPPDGIYTIWTLAGKIIAELYSDGNVKVNIGKPILQANLVPTLLTANSDGRAIESELEVEGTIYRSTAISMGNPHSVIFVSDLDSIRSRFHHLGPLFERHSAFPERVNTEFVQIHNSQHVSMLVWERGAGPTLACGTGASAVVVAGVLTSRTDRLCRVTLPGGDLWIEWNDGHGKEEENTVSMTGPAEAVFTGTILQKL